MKSNEKIVVTSGSAYVDIDVLACSISYVSLLQLLGKDAIAVHSGPFNETIPNYIRGWDFTFQKKIPTNSKINKFVLVDVSDPLYFEDFVSNNDIIEIYDHHFGFEKFWFSKLNSASKIEHVGACATLIWEEFINANMEKHIEPTNANLLYIAIKANTLNLKANITSLRDKAAIEQLEKYIDLPVDWLSKYYNEIERSVISNVEVAISKDLKKTQFNNYNYTIGQLELWDTEKFFQTNDIFNLIKLGLNIDIEQPDRWFLIISDVKQGYNYIVTDNKLTQILLSKILDISFDGWIAKTNSLWMRKEVLREIHKEVAHGIK
tara:strand:- start:6944 stop:7903 length:960 start_codon:yes stop_codon:yes gene_type:complete